LLLVHFLQWTITGPSFTRSILSCPVLAWRRTSTTFSYTALCMEKYVCLWTWLKWLCLFWLTRKKQICLIWLSPSRYVWYNRVQFLHTNNKHIFGWTQFFFLYIIIILVMSSWRRGLHSYIL
jgi:hypothetical protein